MKNNYSRQDKATGLQSGMRVIINAAVLTVFSFNNSFIADIIGVCTSGVASLLPVIVHVYINAEEFKKSVSEFGNIWRKLYCSMYGIVIAVMVLPVHMLLYTAKDISLSSYFACSVFMFVTHVILIIAVYIILNPWMYSLLSHLNKIFPKQTRN